MYKGTKIYAQNPKETIVINNVTQKVTEFKVNIQIPIIFSNNSNKRMGNELKS